jgi:hypothetical protein
VSQPISQTSHAIIPECDAANPNVRISLNWAIGAQAKGTFFHRQVFKHEMVPKTPRTVNDDIWTLNSQSSSQWDGFRHYGFQKEAKFYNGVTMDDLYREGKDGEKSTVNGIHG